MRTLTLTLLAAQLSVLGGCVATEDACDDVCGVARESYEICQQEWGLDYGDPGTYESSEDYDNWCSTWILERRLLAETSEEAAAGDDLVERCQEQRDSLLERDCSTYYGTFDD